MLKSFKSLAARMPDTLFEDAIGLAALVVLLVMGLHLAPVLA